MKISRRVVGFVAVAMLACGSWLASAKDDPPKTDKPKKLEPAKCGAVKQLHVLDDIFLGGQPTADDLAEFKKRGVKSVLNLRAKEELDFNEAAAVKNAGLKYHHIPVPGPDALTDEVFEKIRKLLNSKDERPILVHCASANRVGAVWLAHRVLDGGLSYDDALKESQTVGLKLPALEAKAKAYIAKNKDKKSDAKK